MNTFFVMLEAFILLFIALHVMIIAHEFGHALAMRSVNIKLEKFFSGFGFTFFQKTDAQGTLWSFHLFPLSGGVMFNEKDAENATRW